jgi:hypothetical protein
MRRMLLSGAALAGVCVAATSRLQPELQLHECDWTVYEEGSTRRSYRNLSHFLYHLRELVAVQVPIAEVYLLRAISPALRERIMLVTAYANECAW